MKPQHHEDSANEGSRAARKRAKKKQKSRPSEEHEQSRDDEKRQMGTNEHSKKRPLEEKEKSHFSSSSPPKTKHQKEEGGILKVQPKDTEEVAQEEHFNKGAQVDVDVILPKDIEDLLKSENVTLMNILLLTDQKIDKERKAVAQQKATDSSHNGDNMAENVKQRDNPFRKLTSQQRGRCALHFLLAPCDMSVKDFYEEYWEKKAICVQANDSTNKKRHGLRFDGLLSLASIRQWTEKHTLQYGLDLNVTRYHSVVPGQPKRRANIDPPPFQDAKTGKTKYVEVDHDFVWQQFDENRYVP
jgi:hypothetical protein